MDDEVDNIDASVKQEHIGCDNVSKFEDEEFGGSHGAGLLSIV